MNETIDTPVELKFVDTGPTYAMWMEAFSDKMALK